MQTIDEKYCLLLVIPKTIQSSTTTFILKTVLFLQKNRYMFRPISRHQAKHLQKCTKEGKINSSFDWIFGGITELILWHLWLSYRYILFCISLLTNWITYCPFQGIIILKLFIFRNVTCPASYEELMTQTFKIVSNTSISIIYFFLWKLYLSVCVNCQIFLTFLLLTRFWIQMSSLVRCSITPSVYVISL